MSPLRGFREQGNKGIDFKGTREQMSENEGNRGTLAIFGSRNIGNEEFDFQQQGNKAIYFRGTRKHIFPSLGAPYACYNI